MMYLRPGNLEKDFIVKRKKTDISDTGTPYSGYVDTGLLVRGVLADADKNQSDRKKHLWNQDQHSLTHTIVSKGEPVGYSLADTQETWKYISKLGYDPDNPCVRHGVEVNATSSTGYADGQWTNKLDQTADTTRLWRFGGGLDSGAIAGRFCASLNIALSSAHWHYAARLSASGRCAQKAAA